MVMHILRGYTSPTVAALPHPLQADIAVAAVNLHMASTAVDIYAASTTVEYICHIYCREIYMLQSLL